VKTKQFLQDKASVWTDSW